MAKKDKPFHDAFAGLSKLKTEVQAEPEKPVPQAAPPPPVLPNDEADALARAMQGVRRLDDDGRGAVQRPLPEKPAVADDDDEALIRLASSLDVDQELDNDDGDVLNGGWAKGLDRRIVRQLRRGAMPIDATLNLHGLRRHDLEPALERFLTASLREHARCVLVITGRGSSSESGVAVLRALTAEFLRRGRLVKHVLAYVTSHTNPGAYYVLLRKR